MSEFINTIDLQGDQETLDALVSDTQTEYRDNGSFALCNHALRNRTLLTAVNLPSVTSIGQYAFNGCTGLTSIDFCGSNPITIGANAFNGASNLKDVIIRSNTVSTLSNANAITGTKVYGAYNNPVGAIFVPSALWSTYRTATNWSSLTVRRRLLPLDRYPTDNYETISDSWEDIFANEENGTYSTKYKVGDTKSIDYNGTTAYVEIATIDGDTLSNGSGNAKITWLFTKIMFEKRLHSSSNTTKWELCELRTYLRDTVIYYLPEIVRTNIKEVNKTCYDHDKSILSVAETIWIPSINEVTSTTQHETGVKYSTLFSSNELRIKYYNTTATAWWTRTMGSGGVSAYIVPTTGIAPNKTAYKTSAYGVLLGFCT